MDGQRMAFSPDIVGFSLTDPSVEQLRHERDQARAQLDAVMQLAPCGLAFFDRALRYLEVNEQLADINGIAPAAHIGRTVGELLPNMSPDVVAAIQHVLITGEPFHHEITGETPRLPGQLRFWKVTYFPLRDADDAITGVSAVVVETTQQRWQGARIHAQQTVSERIALGTPLPHILLGVATMVESYLNARPCAVLIHDGAGQLSLGAAPTLPPTLHATLATLPVSLFANLTRSNGPQPLPPTGHELVAPGWGAIKVAARRHGLPYLWAVPISDSNHELLGALLVFAAEDVPLAAADQQIVAIASHLVGIAVERARIEAEHLREQAAAAERQQFLLEASTMLAASLDYEEILGNIARLAVPRLADWCTVEMRIDDTLQTVVMQHTDPAQQALGEAFRSRYPTRLEDEGVGRVMRLGEPLVVPVITPDMFTPSTPDADPVMLSEMQQFGMTSFMAVPLTAHGRTLGALVFAATHGSRTFSADDVALAQELAWRAALAVEHAQLYRDAQEALRTRDQFLSIASHELKTPITALLGFVQLLQRRIGADNMDERTLRTFHTIHEQGRRLTQLIGALLDFSRLQLGQFVIERRPVDLSFLTNRIVSEIEAVLTKHTLEVQISQAPLVVQGDELRLEQVLQNLLQNAFKYSPLGGLVELTLTGDDDHLQLVVRDHGIGIPADALPHLFRRFFRAHNANQHNIGGIGLGLFVIKEIVAQHGGTVVVDSTESVGTTFTIRLPLFQKE